MVKVLVLGGVGFIGRNLCSYLIENDLVDHITVADKVLPATAYLNAKHKAAFDSPKLTFKQANLTNAGMNQNMLKYIKLKIVIKILYFTLLSYLKPLLKRFLLVMMVLNMIMYSI